MTPRLLTPFCVLFVELTPPYLVFELRLFVSVLPYVDIPLLRLNYRLFVFPDRRQYSRYRSQFEVYAFPVLLYLDLRQCHRRPPSSVRPSSPEYFIVVPSTKVYLLCLISGCLPRHLKENTLLTWPASIPDI